MKQAVLTMVSLLMLSSVASAETAKLPKAEATQLIKAAEKLACDRAHGDCGVFDTIVVYKGYAIVLAAVQYAGGEVYVVLKKDGKNWKALHSRLVAIMEEELETEKIPKDIRDQLIKDFNKVMYE